MMHARAATVYDRVVTMVAEDNSGKIGSSFRLVLA